MYENTELDMINPALVEPEQLKRFIDKGGVMYELLGITEDELEAIYHVALNLYETAPVLTNKIDCKDVHGEQLDKSESLCEQLDKAESLFQLLCSYDHYNVIYFRALGACRQAKGEYLKAAETYSMAVLIDVENPYLPFYAAECHMALGDLKSAESGFYAASIRSSNEPELNNKANIMLVRVRNEIKKEEQ